MAKKNKKDKKLIVYIGILIVVIFIIAIFKINQKKSQQIELEEETEQQIQEEKNITETLYNLNERDRMELYFNRFLGYIESEKYEKAYDLLYDEFKNTYFPDFEKFKEYMQNTFSEMTNIRHDNIERNGDVYVLWIYITDALNGKPGEEKKMNIVIKENDYNDFVLSFSVI